jgi:TonB family protein
MRNLSMCLVLFTLVVVTAYGQDEVAPSTPNGPLNVNSAPPKPDAEGVYEVGPSITSPVIPDPVMVTTSEELRASCTPGMVRVEAVVEADGTARIRAVDPPAGGKCSDAVVAALKEIQFQPGTLNDKPVPVAVCIRVPFQYLHPPVPRLVSCQSPMGFGNQPSTANDPFRLPPGARPPVPIHTAEAQFSDEARRERIEGIVLISMIVDEHGMPTAIRVVRSIGHGLDENAVAAVSQYRFRPATVDGNPIAARITIEVSFRFRN